MAEDISYTNGHQRFRYRAATIIIEEGAICFMSKSFRRLSLLRWWSCSIWRNNRRSCSSRGYRRNWTAI